MSDNVGSRQWRQSTVELQKERTAARERGDNDLADKLTRIIRRRIRRASEGPP